VAEKQTNNPNGLFEQHNDVVKNLNGEQQVGGNDTDIEIHKVFSSRPLIKRQLIPSQIQKPKYFKSKINESFYTDRGKF